MKWQAVKNSDGKYICAGWAEYELLQGHTVEEYDNPVKAIEDAIISDSALKYDQKIAKKTSGIQKIADKCGLTQDEINALFG